MKRCHPLVGFFSFIVSLCCGCSSPRERSIYFTSLEEAAEACLDDVERWVEKDLSLPPFDIGSKIGEVSLLKNSQGQHKVLEVHCKPQLKDGDAFATLVPIVRYLKIPETSSLEFHEIEQIVFTASMLAPDRGFEYEYSYPLK